MLERRIGVKIRDYAAGPTLGSGGDERVDIRGRCTLLVDNHIFISRIGREAFESGSALGDGRIFVDVAIVGGFGIDAVEGHAAKFGFRTQALRFFPIIIRCRAIDNFRTGGIGSPTDAHSVRSIGTGASDYGAYVLSNRRLCR